jgi:hypothetical protein
LCGATLVRPSFYYEQNGFEYLFEIWAKFCPCRRQLHRHLAPAAFLAIADRSAGVIFSARAFAPAFPDRTLPDGSFNVSSISPVAILATMIAAPITSAGRF